MNNSDNWTSDVANVTAPNLAPISHVLHVLNIFGLPVLIAIGIGGNMLSFLVFVSKHSRNVSSSVYLAALSLFDTGFLLCVLVMWLDSVAKVHFFRRPGFCQLFVYLQYIFSFASPWIVVSFTTERFIACVYPFHRARIVSTSRARFVVLGLLFFALSAYIYSCFTNTAYKKHGVWYCGPSISYMRLNTALGWADTVITLIIPIIAILVMNIRIGLSLIAVKQINGSRQELQRDGSVSGHSLLHQNERQQLQRETSHTRITKMLVIISSCFIVLNLPRWAIRNDVSTRILTLK